MSDVARAVACAGSIVWHKVEDRLPDVAEPILLAKPDAFGRVPWLIRDAALYISYEGVVPTPDQVADGPTDFWFDSVYPGKGDMRLVRPGLMWAQMPNPDEAARSESEDTQPKATHTQDDVDALVKAATDLCGVYALDEAVTDLELALTPFQKG